MQQAIPRPEVWVEGAQSGSVGTRPFLSMTRGQGPFFLDTSMPLVPLTDLEIEVSNFLCVKVIHPIQDLLNEAGGFLLT